MLQPLLMVRAAIAGERFLGEVVTAYEAETCPRGPDETARSLQPARAFWGSSSIAESPIFKQGHNRG